MSVKDFVNAQDSPVGAEIRFSALKVVTLVTP